MQEIQLIIIKEGLLTYMGLNLYLLIGYMILATIDIITGFVKSIILQKTRSKYMINSILKKMLIVFMITGLFFLKGLISVDIGAFILFIISMLSIAEIYSISGNVLQAYLKDSDKDEAMAIKIVMGFVRHTLIGTVKGAIDEMSLKSEQTDDGITQKSDNSKNHTTQDSKITNK